MNQTDEWDSSEKLAVLFGVCQRSDWFIWQEVMEDKGFHVSILDKRAKLGGDWREILCVFLTLLTPVLRGVKKNEKKAMGGKRKERNRS